MKEFPVFQGEHLLCQDVSLTPSRGSGKVCKLIKNRFQFSPEFPVLTAHSLTRLWVCFFCGTSVTANEISIAISGLHYYFIVAASEISLAATDVLIAGSTVLSPSPILLRSRSLPHMGLARPCCSFCPRRTWVLAGKQIEFY